MAIQWAFALQFQEDVSDNPPSRVFMREGWVARVFETWAGLPMSSEVRTGLGRRNRLLHVHQETGHPPSPRTTLRSLNNSCSDCDQIPAARCKASDVPRPE